MPDKQPDFELAVSQQAQDKTNYEISVNGWIWKAEHANPHDTAEGGHAEGHIWGGRDSYVVRGWVTAIETDGPADYRLDGTKMDKQDVLDYRPPRFRDGGSSGGGASGGSGSSERDTSGSSSVPTSGSTTMQNEDPGLGCVARPLYSCGDIEMHVGDGREYGSLQAAFNAVPHYLQHECRIFVHGRTNDSNTAHIHSVSMANHVDFVVDGSDRGVVNNGGVNVHIAGKMDHIQFDHLKFEHISQCINARFEDCDFNGNGTAAFSGKEGSKMLVDCSVGSGNDEYAAFSVGGEIIEFRECTLHGNKAAIRGNSASTHVLNNCNINAPEKMAGGADDVFIGGERVN